MTEVLPLLATSTLSSDPSAQGFQAIVAPYMSIFFVAFFVSFVLTPLMRILAVRNGIVDWPDLRRKNHPEPVAYLGGVAIFIGWISGIAACFLITSHLNDNETILFPISIIVGAAVITLTGLFDDIYSISPRVKIGGQFFAAAALAWQDVGPQLVQNSLRVLDISPPPVLVYVIGTAVIALFVVGGCNALNLLDGLDGLAAGVSAIACIGFLTIAVMTAIDFQTDSTARQFFASDPVRLIMCLAILGSLLGFLPYNFNPASIFMGDAGSLLIGYLCISTILLFSQTGGRALLLVTACLIVFALPITDTSLAIFRRKMRGKPLFSPDNEHLHHLLRRTGMSVRRSVLVMYAMAMLFAILGVTLVALELRWRYVLAVFFTLYGFILVTAYKYSRHISLNENMRYEKSASETVGVDEERSNNGSDLNNP